MAKDNWFTSLFSMVAPIVHAIVGDVKQAAEELLNLTEERIHMTMRSFVKGVTIFLMLTLGAIFVLVGTSTFLDAIFELVPGAGLMIVGGSLVLLGLFAYAMRN